MGQTLLAQCACGFNQSVNCGSGRFDYGYVSDFPCYCQVCKSMSSLNVRSDKLICPHCESESILPYNNSQMFKGKILADDNEPSAQKDPDTTTFTQEVLSSINERNEVICKLESKISKLKNKEFNDIDNRVDELDEEVRDNLQQISALELFIKFREDNKNCDKNTLKNLVDEWIERYNSDSYEGKSQFYSEYLNMRLIKSAIKNGCTKKSDLQIKNNIDELSIKSKELKALADSLYVHVEECNNKCEDYKRRIEVTKNEVSELLQKRSISNTLVSDDLNKNILDYRCPKCDKFTLFFTTQDYYD